MTKQDKIIAWFLILQGIAGFALTAWFFFRYGIPLAAILMFIPLSIAALIAGIGSLFRRRWAVWLGIAVFALQIPIIVTPSFTFFVWLGIHFDLSFIWRGHAKLGFNLVGLVMLIWASIRCRASNLSSKRTRVPRAA